MGRAKSVYRMGLGHRYGRRMQTISGIHYNWSMPGLSNADYFSLIRSYYDELKSLVQTVDPHAHTDLKGFVLRMPEVQSGGRGNQTPNHQANHH